MIRKLWRLAISGSRVDNVMFKIIAFFILTPLMAVLYLAYLVDKATHPEDN